MQISCPYPPNITPERKNIYHFLAFCITAGTFASLSTQVFARLVFIRSTKLYGLQIAKRIVGRIAEFGSTGISYGLLGSSFFQLIGIVIAEVEITRIIQRIKGETPLPEELRDSFILAAQVPFLVLCRLIPYIYQLAFFVAF